MRRKVFDRLVSTGGVLLVVALVVAGSLAMWGYAFTNNSVHNQLAEQKIFFPTKAEFAKAEPNSEIEPRMIPYLEKYAGQQLLTGSEAEAYADHFIAYHLELIGGGKSYSQLAAAEMALPSGSKAQAAAESTLQTVFQGTTLRGLLLEAYGFSVFGNIALWSGIASYVMALIMLILVLFGFWHARRVKDEEEIFS